MPQDDDEIFSFRLDRMILHWAEATPDRIAVRDHSTSHSFRELRNAAGAIRHQLPSAGHSDGYVAIISDSPFFVLSALTACLLSGRRFVILSPNWKSSVFSKVVDQIAINVFITNKAGAIPALSYAENVKVIDTDLSLMDVLCTGTQHRIHHSLEICSLLTAGSEGIPSAVKKTHHALMSEIIVWVLELRLTSRKIISLAQPLHYAGAILLALATLVCGGMVTFCRSRPETALRGDILEFKPTHLLLIPSQYRRLRDEFGLLEMKSLFVELEIYLSLGDRLSVAMREELLELMPERFVEMWGNTEGLGTIRKADEGFDIKSVGRPFIGDEIYVEELIGCDVDGNNVGRIAGRSDAGAPWHASTKVIAGDDLGYLKDGVLYAIGREQDVFISPTGRIISSWDIEPLVHSWDRMLEIAVVQRDAESVSILVAGVKNVETEKKAYDLIAGFLNRVGVEKYEIKFVNELPLTEIGKIDRKKIRAKAE